MRYLVFVLLAIGLLSCHEEPRQFVCGTCEKQMHDTAMLNDSKNCNGKTLFKAYCASCHTSTTKKTTGPGLQGVLDRIPGGNWKYEFIRNADSVIKSGDGYAVAKFEEYNHTQHTRFPNLANEEIDAILEYCNAAPCL